MTSRSLEHFWQSTLFNPITLNLHLTMTTATYPAPLTERIKTYLKSSPRLKALAHWMLFPANDFRPRWWVRAVASRLRHRRGAGAIVRWNTRLDVVPYNRFDLGERAIVESFATVNNIVGDVLVGKHSLIGMYNSILGPISIGDHVMLAPHVVLSGLNHSFEDVSKPIVHQPTTVRPIVIEDGAWVGAGSIVTAGVRIGRNAVVAGGSVVTRDVPPYSVAAGNPAKVVKQYNFETGEWERTGA